MVQSRKTMIWHVYVACHQAAEVSGLRPVAASSAEIFFLAGSFFSSTINISSSFFFLRYFQHLCLHLLHQQLDMYRRILNEKNLHKKTAVFEGVPCQLTMATHIVLLIQWHKSEFVASSSLFFKEFHTSVIQE